jgi:hypothetical protein
MGDQYADKTIQHIQANNQAEASKFWMELLNHAKQSNRTEELLANVITKSYAGSRSNFYPILEFILRNKIIPAFPLLYRELDTSGHLFGGQEVFVFAQYLKSTCGTLPQLYQSLPQVVRQIVTGPVILKSADNMGYLIASPLEMPCTDRTSCFGYPKSEVFLHKLTPTAVSELSQNTRSQWKFLPPLTMGMRDGFNGTRMAWGFHIKNIAADKYLIVKSRPTSYILRTNTTFDTYYGPDLQCQFLPTLHKEFQGKLLIGVRQKYSTGNTEYLYSSKFLKRDTKISLEKRNGYNIEGKVWEVMPASAQQDSSSMEGNNIVTDDVGNNPKCQF